MIFVRILFQRTQFWSPILLLVAHKKPHLPPASAMIWRSSLCRKRIAASAVSVPSSTNRKWLWLLSKNVPWSVNHDPTSYIYFPSTYKMSYIYLPWTYEMLLVRAQLLRVEKILISQIWSNTQSRYIIWKRLIECLLRFDYSPYTFFFL